MRVIRCIGESFLLIIWMIRGRRCKDRDKGFKGLKVKGRVKVKDRGLKE